VIDGVWGSMTNQIGGEGDRDSSRKRKRLLKTKILPRRKKGVRAGGTMRVPLPRWIKDRDSEVRKERLIKREKGRHQRHVQMKRRERNKLTNHREGKKEVKRREGRNTSWKISLTS